MWEVAEKKRLYDLCLNRSQATVAARYPEEYREVLAEMRRRCAGRRNARQNARSLAMGEMGRRHREELLEEMSTTNRL